MSSDVWGVTPSSRIMLPHMSESVCTDATSRKNPIENRRDIAIAVNNITKCYQIYEKPLDRLKQFLIPRLCRVVQSIRKFFHAPYMPLPTYHRSFWALQDVSFEVYKGETVGIIGRNGSGKSTLLQMVCGTLRPTGGSIFVQGRVAALLELGAGFDPEFTGRDNVYMNAAVLGLSKEETESHFEDIVTFADIGDFIEQPLKTYSTGMAMRLAVAIAINVAPDILIIDEALSVGDEAFQRKCFARLETIRASGATILFVSHSGSQIVEICDRAVLLDFGEILTIGTPKQVVSCYQKLLHAPADRRDLVREQIRRSRNCYNQPAISTALDASEHDVPADEPLGVQEGFDPTLRSCSTMAYESRGAYFESVSILDMAGNEVNSLITGKRYRYVYLVRFTEKAKNVGFGMLIRTVSGVELGGATSANVLNCSPIHADHNSAYRVEFSFQCRLNPGTYFLTAGIMGEVNGEQGYLHRLLDATMFRVQSDGSEVATGLIDFSCVPEIEELEVRHNG